MPVGCEGVPGAGGARDKWTSRVYQPRLAAGEETQLRVQVLSLPLVLSLALLLLLSLSLFALGSSGVFGEVSRSACRPLGLTLVVVDRAERDFPLNASLSFSLSLFLFPSLVVRPTPPRFFMRNLGELGVVSRHRAKEMDSRVAIR